jgi:ribosomal protein S18 acetylase RimI-like enzyme
MQNDHGRFKQTFIRQHAEQELRRLVAATAEDADVSAPTAPCVALIATALDARGEQGPCMGTLDILPPASFSGRHPKGVPDGDSVGAYLLNVVTAECWRRRGVGGRLVEEAKVVARASLYAERAYAHVDATNDDAMRVYLRCGFEVVGSEGEGGMQGAYALGRRILLRCELGGNYNDDSSGEEGMR